MNEKTCKTCAIRYKDGFCMQKCTYMNDEDKCQLWTDESLSFDYDRVYMLCEKYLNLCKDYNEFKRLCKIANPNETLILSGSSYEFFFNCVLNDLHREMSLYRRYEQI